MKPKTVLQVVATLCVLLLLSPAAHAQIIFDRADIESEFGATYSPLSYMAEDGQTSAIQTLLGQTGASQTWDFTTLTFGAGTGSTTTQEYIALPDGSLPGSGDARVSDATFAIKSTDSNAQPGDFSVTYFGLSDTEYNTYGLWAIEEGFGHDLLYDSALLNYPLPFTYGTTFNGQTSYQQDAGGIQTSITIERDGEGTGWGTLVLPTGSYEALRYDVTITTTATVFGFGSSVVSTITTFSTKDGIGAGITVTNNAQIGDIITASYSVNDPNQGSVDPPATAPTTPSPANGASASTAPLLDWDDVADATAYDLQVATGTFGKNTPDVVVVDETGLTSSSYQVNGLDNSTTYFWRVRGTNEGGAGAWSSSFSFETEAAPLVLPGAVTLTAPADAATGVSTSPTMDWDAASDATSYDVQVSTDAGFATIVLDQNGVTDTQLSASGLSYSTAYFWRVRGVNADGNGEWSSASFTTEAAPLVLPGAVTLVAPADAATGVSTSPTMDWDAASDATSYDVQVSTDASFATTVLDQNGVTDTQLAASGLSFETAYFWRVRGVNTDGNGDWSSASFTTEAAPLVLPGAVTLTSPSDGAVDVELQATLSWEAAANADSYDVEIALDASFTDIVTAETGITELSLARGLVAGTQHHWRVRAVNLDGTGDWSSASFTTVSGVSVEQLGDELPSTFQLHGAYPNPFNPQTTIRFDLSEPVQVSLTIWDAAGRLVDTLVDGAMSPGQYAYRWDAGSRNSGLYLIRVTAGQQIQSSTVMLIK